VNPAGFTLTDFAFPVAPAELSGFTVTGFAWLSIAPPAVTPLEVVTFVSVFGGPSEFVSEFYSAGLVVTFDG
jgi:hypothetical protein